MSATPDLGPSGFAVNDKVVHFGLYFVLGAALALGRGRSGATVAHGLLIALASLYGVTDEWHQSFVPGRDPSFFDWVADTLGGAVGYATFQVAVGNRLLGRGEPQSNE